jgi:arylformamidase
MTRPILVDLSMSITPDMPTNRPDHRPPEFAGYAAIDTHGWRGTMVTIDTHCGTHVDAPSHFVADGAPVDAVALDVLIGPATLLTVDPDVPGRATDVPELPTDLAGRVVVHTGWSDRLASNPDGYFRRHAYLSESFARRLVAAGIVLVGIDTPSIDGEGDAAHHILLGAGVIVVENLANTALLPSRFDLTVLPLRLKGLDGSPARAIASVRERA